MPFARHSPLADRADSASARPAATIAGPGGGNQANLRRLGGGQALQPTTRRFMESRFQRDLGDVRIHADSDAARSAGDLGAAAYASGRDIVFGQGRYAPSTPGGMGLLAHEITHVVQQARGGGDPHAVEPVGSPAEREADQVGRRIGLGLPAGPIAQAVAGVALTPTSAVIEPLISYSGADWEVTAAEEAKVVAALASDPDVSATVRDMDASKMLGPLINRVDGNTARRQLLQILGAKSNMFARGLIDPFVALLDPKWQLQFNLARLGVTSGAPAFDPTPFAKLIGGKTGAFSGAGATGVDPTTVNMSYFNQVLVAGGHGGTVAEFSNPLPGSLPAYLAGLSSTDRTQQAELMLKRPIVSSKADSYQGALPSRAQIIGAAAKLNRLNPQHLAGFLLAEQRDQSSNEDAKDWEGATSTVYQKNTSLGLGQVVISTARKNNLFRDLLSPGAISGLSHNDIARLLTSDEFNIFAAARYIRKVADDGSKIDIAKLPKTLTTFPAIDMPAYAGHSSTWPDDNLRALGSEYTSKPWDDRLSPGWGEFVFQAFKDVEASGVTF